MYTINTPPKEGQRQIHTSEFTTNQYFTTYSFNGLAKTGGIQDETLITKGIRKA